MYGVPRTGKLSSGDYFRQIDFQVIVFKCGYGTYDLSLSGTITAPDTVKYFSKAYIQPTERK